MKPRLSTRHETAMTLFEVGVVVAVLLIVVAVLLPNLRRPRRSSPATRINCINNLKQIGLAYRIWEGDNGDTFPMGVSVTNGGSMEMASTGNVVQSFLVMSNELSTPQILHCPADISHMETDAFTGLASYNLSYFVGVNATNEVNPQMILSGDANFEISGVAVKSGLAKIPANVDVAWSSGRHTSYDAHFWTRARDKFVGNIGLADGSVQQLTTDGLQKSFQQTGLATNCLVIP